MQRIYQMLFFLTLLLSACSVIPAAPQTVPPGITETPIFLPTTAVPGPKMILTLSTPHIDQPPDGLITSAPPDPQNCGYQWAYQDLPELSSSFQQSLQTLQPDAQGNAYIFGENCILPDGSIGSFLARETDFNVTVQVTDLNDESDLGAWIVQMMQIITQIPPEQIVGPLPGRVFVVFQAGSDQRPINFGIDQYLNLPAGLDNAEIFQALQAPQ